MNNKYLPLSAIQCRPYLQQRKPGLIEDKSDYHRQIANLESQVEDMRSDLYHGQSIRTPLEIHEVNGEYLLVDGHHRYKAITAHCEVMKLDPDLFDVPVNITATSTLKEAISASFTVNLDHGVGLSSKERVQASFRNYVWTRLVPKQADIMKSTGYLKGAASNIANAAKYCIALLNSNKVTTPTPTELKVFMTKKMIGLDIDPSMLDAYGLPTYSLLRRVLKGDDYMPDSVLDEQEMRIRLVRQAIEIIENRYGVDCLREGLRRHKTAAYGITISQRKAWVKEPTTAALLALELDKEDDF